MFTLPHGEVPTLADAYIHIYRQTDMHARTHACIYTYLAYIHTYIHVYIHTSLSLFMVSELGECISCFPGATGSDLGNGMRTFVKAKKGFNIP